MNPELVDLIVGAGGGGVAGTVSVSGTVPVTLATGTVSISGPVAVSVSTGVVSVSNTVVVSGVVGVSNITTGTVSISGPINASNVYQVPIMVVVTSTALPSGAATVAFTVYTGVAQAGAGTTAFTVTAAHALWIMQVALWASNSVTTTPVSIQAALIATTSGVAVIGVAATAAIQALAYTVATSAGLVVYNQVGNVFADMSSGVVYGVGVTMGTTGNLVKTVISGFLY